MFCWSRTSTSTSYPLKHWLVDISVGFTYFPYIFYINLKFIYSLDTVNIKARKLLVGPKHPPPPPTPSNTDFQISL